MERIVENQPACVTLLKMQYRMHEQIMRFSSNEFYHGQMEAAPTVSHRSILDYDTPILWIESGGVEGRGGGSSLFNKEEAVLSIQTLEAYVEKIGRARYQDERLDVGIITPYRLQAQYLRSLLKKSETLRPIRSTITVNTVDGFQGQERDIIIISLVRSNEHGQIGFLNDLRRMNVAMTRARMKLIIIGDSSTLCHHPFYHRLKKYVDEL